MNLLVYLIFLLIGTRARALGVGRPFSARRTCVFACVAGFMEARRVVFGILWTIKICVWTNIEDIMMPIKCTVFLGLGIHYWCHRCTKGGNGIRFEGGRNIARGIIQQLKNIINASTKTYFLSHENLPSHLYIDIRWVIMTRRQPERQKTRRLTSAIYDTYVCFVRTHFFHMRSFCMSILKRSNYPYVAVHNGVYTKTRILSNK